MRTYDVGGLVRIGLEGDASGLDSALERAFSPYRSSVPAEIVVRVGPRPTGKLRTLGRSPVAVDRGRAFAVDHLGRAADLPLDRITDDEVELRVEAGFYPSTFFNRVLQPLLRARLALRRDTALVHAAGFVHEDERTVLAGWSGAGKTTLMLQALRDGAHYLGNDWVLLDAAGVAHPYSLQLNVYRRTLAGFPGLVSQLPHSTRRSWRVKLAAERLLAGLSRAAAPVPALSRAMAEIARLSSESAPLPTSVDAVVDGLVVGDAGSLDLFVLLDDVSQPTIVDPELAAERVITNLRYESVTLWSDWLAAAYGTGRAPIVDDVLGAEADIVRSGLAETRCVISHARDVHRAREAVARSGEAVV